MFSEAVGPPASICGMIVACIKDFQGILNIMTLALTQGHFDLEKGSKKEKNGIVTKLL